MLKTPNTVLEDFLGLPRITTYIYIYNILPMICHKLEFFTIFLWERGHYMQHPCLLIKIKP